METRPALVPAALAAILEEIPALVAVMLGDDLVVEYANRRLTALAGDRSPLHRPAADVLAQVMGPASAGGYAAAMRRVYERHAPEVVNGSPVRLAGQTELTFFDIASLPLPGGGGVVLHATDVTAVVRARQRAEVAESRYTRLAESGVVGVAITSGTDVTEANDAFLDMTGRTRADVAAGLAWSSLIEPATLAAERETGDALARTGVMHAHEMALRRTDGTSVTALTTAAALPDGTTVGVFFDVTARKAAERSAAEALRRERRARGEAERAKERMERLQEATSDLGDAQRPDAAARVLARHAVEVTGAAAAVVALGDAPSRLEPVHAIGLPVDRLHQWRDFPATLPAVLDFAVRTRAPVDLADSDAVEAASPELVDEPLGAQAALALPLIADARPLGALLLVFREPRDLEAEARGLLGTLTGLAAAAVDRAQLYEDRVYVADRLQRGLLPSVLPQPPGLHVAVSYHAITGGGEVGGDFYDLFEAAEDRWTVAVGDVCGKGTEAAAVTGLARHTVRAAARLLDGPAATLGFLNDQLRLGERRPPFCTVACADLSRDEAGWHARISSGGHPFPLVVRADPPGVEEVTLRGTMLGVDDDPRLGERDVRLRRGDALVLYTDGVTDARAADGERFGEARLIRALRLGADGGAEGLLAAVDEAVRAFQPGPPADDRAMVVLAAG